MKRFLTRREWRGFLVAPLAAPLSAAFLIVLFSFGGAGGLSGFVEIAGALAFYLVMSLIVGGPVAYFAAAVFGLPVLKWMQLTNRVSFFYILGFSGLLGGFVFLLIWGISSWDSDLGWFQCTGRGRVEPCSNLDLQGWLYNLMTLGFFLMQGLAAGGVFWLIAYRDRGGGSGSVEKSED